VGARTDSRPIRRFGISGAAHRMGRGNLESEAGGVLMKLRCTHCGLLLELLDPPEGHDIFEVECSSCHGRFRIRLNRPALKVRRPRQARRSGSAEPYSPPFSESAARSAPPPPFHDEETPPSTKAAEDVVLTGADVVENHRILDELGSVSVRIPVRGIEEDRSAAFLLALNRARRALQRQAALMGAGAVVSLRLERPEEKTSAGRMLVSLELSGRAVRLSPLTS